MDIDYEKDSVVDPDNLDKEILEHGQRFMQYAKLAADAEEKEKLAKQRTQIIRAKVRKIIRRNPKKYGIKDVPATVLNQMVKDEVEVHPRVIKADKKLFQISKEASILENAAKEMGRYKLNMIETFAQMAMRGFFLEPSIKLDKEDYAEAYRKKTRKLGMKQRKLLMKKER